MTLTINQFVGKLKIPLFNLLEVSVQVGGGNWERLTLISCHELEELHRKHPMVGRPRYAAYENGQYILAVYPRVSRRYRLCVVGLQVVTQ